MNKRQKELIQYQYDKEKAILKELEKQYRRALNDIEERIKMLMVDDMTQSRIYHVEYQKTLRSQVQAIIDKLYADEYTSIEHYLADAYTTGFVGTMYDIHGQRVPVLVPINQKAAVKAIITESKIKGSLYEALGVDANALKKTISQEITRGIATGLTYSDIARNIHRASGVPLSRAKTIARTDGHRIMQASAEDARQASKAKGADVVKQWDATLDGDTRPTHRALDGQIRELDEPFEYGNKTAMHPGDFGDPAEDCNCRCVALTRARWALDEDELETLKERAAYFGLDKTKDFDDFRAKYLGATVQESDVSFWDLKGNATPKVEYSIALSNRYEEGTDVAKAVYEKYVPHGGAVVNSRYSDIAHHNEGRIYMNYAEDAVNVRGAGTTFFHEHGHLVDYKAGYISDSEEYLNALKDDLKALYASTGMKHKRDAEYEIARMLGSEDVRHKVNGISDIVYGLTKGKTGGRWYHKKPGYYKGNALQREAFAHMFEASFSAEKQALMKQYFPSAWKLFNEMMEGIL